MTRIFSKLKRSREQMPSFVKSALIEYGLMKAYKLRPPYQQNDWLRWIKRAVRKETKQKRLHKMLGDLKRGDVYMGMKWNPK